jgi:hypothetical protein
MWILTRWSPSIPDDEHGVPVIYPTTMTDTGHIGWDRRSAERVDPSPRVGGHIPNAVHRSNPKRPILHPPGRARRTHRHRRGGDNTVDQGEQLRPFPGAVHPIGPVHRTQAMARHVRDRPQLEQLIAERRERLQVPGQRTEHPTDRLHELPEYLTHRRGDLRVGAGHRQPAGAGSVGDAAVSFQPGKES